MLLKELKIGDRFRFATNDKIIYLIKEDNITWGDSNQHSVKRSSYNHREIIFIEPIKMNAIEALQAIKAGKKVWQPTWGKGTDRPNYIHLKNGKIWSNYGEREYSFYVYNFDEVWEEYIDPLVEVKLNKEYSAVLTKDGIEVGCQKFTYEKLDELVNASKEFRKT